MRVLVTGGTGLLGNNLLRHLLTSGYDVRALVRGTNRKELQGLDVTVVQGDVLAEDICRQAVAGADCVVHCAALIHLGHRQLAESRSVNVQGTLNVATAALEAGANMIQVSSVDALAAGRADQPADEQQVDPAKVDCAYVTSKREADQAFLELVRQNLRGCIVHPGLMFGAFDWKPSSGKMITAIARQFVPFAPAGGITALDVLDACRGIETLIQRLGTSAAGSSPEVAGQRYILGGHCLTYLELWRLIARQLERRGPWGKLRPLLGFMAGRGGDCWARIRGTEGEVNSAAIALGSLYNFHSSEKACSELDYSISELQPAIDRAIAFLKTNHMLQKA